MERRLGFAAMFAAAFIWGNLLLVFFHIRYVPVMDVIAHRIIWGMLTLLLWLAYQKRLKEIIVIFKKPKELLMLALAAFFVIANWLGFVWAVTHHHGLEAGLGYFIFPLVSIAFGALFKGEKLDRLAQIAILIASLAVFILTFGLGKLPWISIYLALTFAIYSFIKSNIQIGAVISVAVENIILFPVAALWLVGFAQFGFGFDYNASAGFWLIISGILTATALIGFSFATKTIGLVATGMMFFINPTLQVLNTAFILHEPLTIWHKMAFPLIIIACALYCYDLWRHSNKDY